MMERGSGEERSRTRLRAKPIRTKAPGAAREDAERPPLGLFAALSGPEIATPAEGITMAAVVRFPARFEFLICRQATTEGPGGRDPA